MCVYSFVQWSCGCYCWLLQWIQLFWSRVLAQITRKTESVASTTKSCLFSVLHSISIWKPSKISSNLRHSHPDWKKNSYLSWLCPGVPVCILWVRVVEVVGSQNCHWLFICSPHNSTFHAAHWGGGVQDGSGAIKASFHFSSRLWPQTRPPSLQGCAPSPLNCISCCSYFCLMASLCSPHCWPCLLIGPVWWNKMRGVFMSSGKKKKNPSIVTSQLFRHGDNSSSF